MSVKTDEVQVLSGHCRACRARHHGQGARGISCQECSAVREQRLSGQYCSNQQQGFTLLEILIALAIFAVMSMMAYAGLAAILHARAATEPRSQQLAQLQTTLYLLNEDLTQAINRPIRDEFGSPEPAFTSGRGNEVLVFTRSVPVWSSNGAGNSLHRVSYRFENGALYRQVWSLPDRTPQTQYRRKKLMTVEQVSINFYSEEAQTWLPFNGSGGSPDALEINFKLAGLGSIQRLFLLQQ